MFAHAFALFADSQTCSVSWLALAGTVVTGGFTALGLYLSTRNNGRVTVIEAAAKACEEKHTECEKERAADKAELKAIDARDRAALQAQITALKAQVATKKDKADE